MPLKHRFKVLFLCHFLNERSNFMKKEELTALGITEEQAEKDRLLAELDG